MKNRDTKLLFPPFYKLLDAALREAWSKGLQAHVFEGYRSHERQTLLYAQGRTTTGKVVTWAKAGDSLHQYGLAVDIVFDGLPQEGIQWDWLGDYIGTKKDDYKNLALILKKHGLEWLGDKGIEKAHFQKTWGVPLEKIKLTHKLGGIAAVWAMLDEFAK